MLYIAIIIIIIAASLFNSISEGKKRRNNNYDYNANRNYNTELQNQNKPINYDRLTEEVVTESDGSKKTKLILDTIEHGSDLRFKYTDFNKRQSIRTITPHSMYKHNDTYYVKGLCHNDNIVKTFRLSRMTHMEERGNIKKINTPIQDIEDSTNESKTKLDKQRTHLNPESELKKIGYNTGLEKQERQSILLNVAVPQLGAKKVKAHLEFLIRLNSSKTDSKMDRALEIWKEDLGILESSRKFEL